MYPNEYNIINLFVLLNKPLFLRQIQRKTNISLKSVQNSLKKLENQSILTSENIGKNKFFNINKKNPKSFYILQIAENIKTLKFIEKNKLLKTFIEKIILKDFLFVVVFGSFANNKNTKDSDLDLFIVSDKEPNIPEHLSSYNIHIINMSKKEFEKNIKLKSELINEIFKNHVIIKNHSIFIKYLWSWLK